MTEWERTRYGGFRRTGVAQMQSAAATRQETGPRKTPPVLKIKFAEKLGMEECPYMIRWRIETRWGSLRLHHWRAPDDDRHFHDHPWGFTTVVLAGGYTDRSPEGDDHLRRGSIRHRPAEHQHTVVPDQGGAWTLVITGPKIRDWGFWVLGKFRKANKYFAKHGHHPCDHEGV